MSILRNILASFLVLLLIVLTMPFATLAAMAQSYLNPEFYKSETFQVVLAPLVWEDVSESILEKSPLLATWLTQEELQSAFQEGIPSEVIGEQVESILSQMGQAEFPEEIVISTQGFKENFPKVMDILKEKNSAKEFLEEEESLLEALETQLPDQITISTENLPNTAQETFFLLGAGNHLIMESMISMIIFFTLLIGLVIWKPRSKAVAWMGTALFLNGATLFLWDQTIKQGASVLVWSEVNPEKIEELFSPLYTHLAWYSVVLILLGATGWFAAAKLSSHPTQPTP